MENAMLLLFKARYQFLKLYFYCLVSSALINKIRRQDNYNLRPSNYKLVSSLLLHANIHSGKLY